MRYWFAHAPRPADVALLERLDSAAQRLEPRLLELDPAELHISDYHRRYLAEALLANVRRTLQMYNFLLGWSLEGSGELLENRVLVDYGGGSGLLAVLAVELGVGTVIYNDIYEVSCRDATLIGAAVGAQASQFVEGDVATLAATFSEAGIAPDVVVSNNVLEHVYDELAHLRGLSALAPEQLTLAFATDANPYNPRIRRKLEALHRQVEVEGRPPKWGDKPVDERRPFRDVRREQLRSHRPEIAPDSLEVLVTRTRGMRTEDIESAADDWSSTGQLPPEPKHPTNTCDPHTGNWSERLHDFARLEAVLDQERFGCRLMPGYYAHPNSQLKALAMHALNLGIRVLGGHGAVLAPFVLLRCRRT